MSLQPFSSAHISGSSSSRFQYQREESERPPYSTDRRLRDKEDNESMSCNDIRTATSCTSDKSGASDSDDSNFKSDSFVPKCGSVGMEAITRIGIGISTYLRCQHRVGRSEYPCRKGNITAPERSPREVTFVGVSTTINDVEPN